MTDTCGCCSMRHPTCEHNSRLFRIWDPKRERFAAPPSRPWCSPMATSITAPGCWFCAKAVRRPSIRPTASETLSTVGLSILPVLGAYGRVDWREVTPGPSCAISDRNGAPTGIAIEAFCVASKPPPYMLRHASGTPGNDLAGDTVGLMVRGTSGARVAYVPGVRDLDEALAKQFAQTDEILVDAT